MPQPKRTETLERFKNGEIRLLVCSDVAARGLDIQGLSATSSISTCRIHAEDYVHRIGRTGRAGRRGPLLHAGRAGRRQGRRRDPEADRQGHPAGRRSPESTRPNSISKAASAAAAAAPRPAHAERPRRASGPSGRAAERDRRERAPSRAEAGGGAAPSADGRAHDPAANVAIVPARAGRRGPRQPRPQPRAGAAGRRVWRRSAGLSRAAAADRRSRLSRRSAGCGSRRRRSDEDHFRDGQMRSRQGL